MARPKKKKLKKIMNKKQLNKQIRKLEADTKVLYKLHFIRHLYNGKTIKEPLNWKKLVYQRLING